VFNQAAMPWKLGAAKQSCRVGEALELALHGLAAFHPALERAGVPGDVLLQPVGEIEPDGEGHEEEDGSAADAHPPRPISQRPDAIDNSVPGQRDDE
jgi:hypothetical protein